MTALLDHATLMALDLPELRRRLVVHQAARPADPFDRGMAEWIDTKGAIAFAIERKEGEMRSPAFTITVPPQPIEGLRVQPELDFDRMTPTRRHARPLSNEDPMPTKTPPRPAGDPQERLTQLLARLHHNEETKNAGAAYQTRGDIRKHCAAHGLEVPEEARKRSVPPPTSAQRPNLPKKQESDATARLRTKQEVPKDPCPRCGEPWECHRADGEGAPVCQADLGTSTALSLSSPAARIRALRSQALDILPDLEDLTEDQARDVRRELGLLSETLVLGSHLSERSA